MRVPSFGESNRLRVFISSRMAELRDVREVVERCLGSKNLDAWVYESQAGARPETVEQTSLEEVEAADVYVGLFWQKYGAVTVKEFLHARSLDKPCFVYIRDKDLKRDDELEQFLKSNIYALESGVTYDYFGSATDLGEQASDDIMKWLVRRHREMTAEIEEARISQHEVRRLQSEIDRLQSASLAPLPKGTSIDYLAQHLRAWFQTLGYRFESHDIRTDEYFEWIINVPARRGYDRILVRGIEGEAKITDVGTLREATANAKTDEGWLIVARRKSQAVCDELATSTNHIYCYTLDEIIDESADFTGYLSWLDAEIERRGINTAYVPLACKKEEIDPTTGFKVATSDYDERNGWAEGYIDRWLDDPAKEHVSVLGEFGTGKTWFALHYAWIALQRYREAKARGVERPRLPLVIPLRDYAKAVSVESLFSEFFFRKHEIPLPGYSAFEQLNKMGKLLLIFDGFDEMAAKVDRQQMINNFWELARVVVPGSKAILTCRSEHFPEAKEGRALLNAELMASTAALTGRPPQFEVLELEKFNQMQIRQALSFHTTAATVDLIMGNHQLTDLASRPILIEYILEALPDIEEGKPIDMSRVYLYAVRRKMERDIKEERSFTSIADKLYFLCELSWEMLSTNQLSINYRMFPERLKHLFGDAVQEQKDLDHWHYDMMGQAMLIRNSDGDYTPAHKSLLEFFVGYKFSAEIAMIADDFLDLAREQSNVDVSAVETTYTWTEYFRRAFKPDGTIQQAPALSTFEPEPTGTLAKTFGKEPLTSAMVDLMETMLTSDGESRRVKSLAIMQTTKEKSLEQVGYLGGNLATLLVRLDKSALSNSDLSGVNLNGAKLGRANLSDSLLVGTNLSHANLNNAVMKNAVLKGATLTDIALGLSGWIVSLGLRKPFSENLIAFLYPPGRPGHDVGSIKLPFVLESDEIAVAKVEDGRLVWAHPMKTVYIVEQAVETDLIQILTIENRIFNFDAKTGEAVSFTDDSLTRRWLGADLDGVKGLDSKRAYILSVLGALNTPETEYDPSKDSYYWGETSEIDEDLDSQ